MKEIIYNYDNLNNDEIDEIVVRTKGLIINCKDEIMLGYSDKTYQFPGGHLEENETLLECLKREIREETGIELKDYNLKPFVKITHLTKNYRKTGKNRKNEIYYYIIKTDKLYDKNNTNLDEGEIKGNYKIVSIPLKNVEKVLLESIQDNPINKIIVKEMLNILKEYNKIKVK